MRWWWEVLWLAICHNIITCVPFACINLLIFIWSFTLFALKFIYYSAQILFLMPKMIWYEAKKSSMRRFFCVQLPMNNKPLLLNSYKMYQQDSLQQNSIAYCNLFPSASTGKYSSASFILKSYALSFYEWELEIWCMYQSCTLQMGTTIKPIPVVKVLPCWKHITIKILWHVDLCKYISLSAGNLIIDLPWNAYERAALISLKILMDVPKAHINICKFCALNTHLSMKKSQCALYKVH